MRTRIAQLAALAGATAVLAGCRGSDAAQKAPTTAPAATSPAITTAPAATGPATVTTARAATISIRVVGGVPQGGIARPKVATNENVVLVVRSDRADEIHLHGYDISRELAAGGTTRIEFVARIPGRFELELERSGVQLAELTVQ